MRFFRYMSAAFFVFVLIAAGGRQALAKMPVPEISAPAAIVAEASTGRVLYEKNSDDRHYPASMTKMMTCILGLEKGNPETIIIISPQAAAEESSDMGLAAGDELRFSELLQGMMLVSDNGAAEAAAEYLGGDVPGSFAAMMNEKATALGMYNTHFVNPNGLPNDDHYSTARDMLTLACYSWQNEDFRRIVGCQQKTIYWQLPAGKTATMETTNELLKRYPGLNGIKTGWTEAARGCLAGAAKRNGVELIAIVMASPTRESRFTDAGKLLDYGFSCIKEVKSIKRDDMEREVLIGGGSEYKTSVRPAHDLTYPLLEGETEQEYTLRYDMPRALHAPLQIGEKAGEVVLCHNGQEAARAELLTDEAVSSGWNLLSLGVSLYDKLAGFCCGR